MTLQPAEFRFLLFAHWARSSGGFKTPKQAALWAARMRTEVDSFCQRFEGELQTGQLGVIELGGALLSEDLESADPKIQPDALERAQAAYRVFMRAAK